MAACFRKHAESMLGLIDEQMKDSPKRVSWIKMENLTFIVDLEVSGLRICGWYG